MHCNLYPAVAYIDTLTFGASACFVHCSTACITQYIETVLIPGGPVTSLNTILTAANQGQLDQVAAGFNTAVAHNYTNQLIDIVKEVSAKTAVIKAAQEPVTRLFKAGQGLY